MNEESASCWRLGSRAGARVDPSRLLLCSILVVAAAVQAGASLVGPIPWTSDQAVVAIMAEDILRGVHPAFYYGSAYAGTLEPHWVAAVFSLMGASVGAYRLAIGVLLTAFVWVVYRLARTRFSGRTALLAAAYLALPPWFLLYKGLTSDGHYVTAAILGAGCLCAALRLEDSFRAGKGTHLRAVALGLVSGAAWWTDPLSSYFFLGIAVWFLVVQPAILSRLSLYPLFLSSFLVGGFPWWISNIRWDWKSLRAPELATADLPQALSQLKTVATLGMPILFGSRPVFYQTATYPGELLVSLALGLVPLGAALVFVWKWRKKLRRGGRLGKPRAARALFLLVLVVLCGVAAVSVSGRSDLVEPRFLFPLYGAFAILFAFSVCRLFRDRLAGRVLAVTLLTLALYTAVRGFVVADLHRVSLDRTNDGSLEDLISELRNRGLRSVYASYWVAYRLAFESNEAIIGTPFGEHRTQRIDRYRRQADADPRPAFVLSGAEGAQLAGFFNPRNVDYREFSLGPFRVFYDVDRATLALLRATLQIPAPAP